MDGDGLDDDVIAPEDMCEHKTTGSAEDGTLRSPDWIDRLTWQAHGFTKMDENGEFRLDFGIYNFLMLHPKI